MACEILIAAIDLNVSKKGYPLTLRDLPWTWGKAHHPPNYVFLRITDAPASQVEHFMKRWHKKFAYDIIAENDQGYRIRVKVDPALVSASNINRDVRVEMKTYIQRTFGAVIHSYEDFEAVVDVPKPIMQNGREVTLAELKADIHDKFAEVFDKRHFYFSSSDVDYALTQPDGRVERTKAQVLSMIKNKLDE